MQTLSAVATATAPLADLLTAYAHFCVAVTVAIVVGNIVRFARVFF